ncbi:unnamed protein product, partial [marine sediment metagenome]
MIKDKIKKIIAGAALMLTLKGTPALADSWASIQPAYNVKANHATMRVETGADINNRLKFYGFADADAAEERKLDFDNFYGEARLGYEIKDNLDLAVEVNEGNNMKPLLRYGLIARPKLGKNNFTQLKLLDADVGAQLGLFTTQKLTDKLDATLVMDYNFDGKTAFIEPELKYKLD